MKWFPLMTFHGRSRELAVLRSAHEAEKSGFIPVYGRRRVGKSEMIVHFMERHRGIYFVGKRAPGEVQMQEFLEVAARSLNEPLLAQVRVATWKAALELVVSRWKGKGKLVLALDEYQWMAEASPELPSVIQELWDRQWSKSGRMLLILCGSYLGFMEREVLGKRSPLYGRRTAHIQLQPFSHLEAAAFHPHCSEQEKARIYFVCGGIPAYLLAFDGRCSVEQNITRNILDDNAALSREPEFLLREELRDLMPFHAVLMALAQGKSSPAQLSKTTGFDVRNLGYHLNTLVNLGYVQRRYPITEAKPSARSVRYALDDSLLRFWFRFVFPHQSLLRVLGPAAGFAEVVKPHLDAYFGRCFERLCRECLPLLYAKEGVRTAFTVGEYWDKEMQVDVVSVRQDRWIDLGECKWGAPSSLAAMAAELEEKVRRYPNARNATIQRRLFMRSGPPKAKRRPSDVPARVHTLEELYQLKAAPS